MAITTKKKFEQLLVATQLTSPAEQYGVLQRILDFAGQNLFDSRGNFIPINWWNVVRLIQIAKFVVELIRYIIDISKGKE